MAEAPLRRTWRAILEPNATPVVQPPTREIGGAVSAIKVWFIDTLIRATKTFAQTVAGILGANAVNVLTTDWKTDLAVGLGAFIASFLQNVQSFPTPKVDSTTRA